MKYTGTYTQRAQAQRTAALRRIVRTAAKIESTDTMNRLLLITRQMQHIDSGKASQAERLRDMINVWTVYHDDIEELKLMFGLVTQVATMKARKAQRAAKANA